jgi:acetoin utilization deacetylase AcuC-like enzyme
MERVARPRPVFLSHHSSLEHDTGAHPEQPARITAIHAELSRHEYFGFTQLASPPVAREVLERVHPAAYVEMIARAAARGGGQLDLDTVVSSGSFEAALHAAGGAVKLVELLLAGAASCGFSAHRPPGHHAPQARAMGFCLFNNVAIAARHAVDSLGCSRVLILDWDVHHGNGTNDIFHASPEVLTISIHQWPLYPGTGPASDVGSGAGTGFTVNLPVGRGSGDDVYLSLVSDVVVPLTLAYEPELILVSAGYDAHREDPLGECAVTDEGFAEMTRLVRDLASRLGVPVGCVLEGGYALDALGRSVAATLEALASDAPAASSGGVGAESAGGVGAAAAVALQARQRLARWWPTLS